MGIYDQYGRAQIKIGIGSEPECYAIGDDVPLTDGVYLDYGTVIVIKNRKFVAEFDCLKSKWGDNINPSDVIDNFNPD